jgi:purine-binding chemotaxis protein CheW
MVDTLVKSVVVDDEDTLTNRFLTFFIDKETYGIEIRFVMQIIGIQAITEMPEMPEYVKGIINLRGKIIPVMDVRLRFSKVAKEYDDRTCVIVIDFNSISFGLIVDGIAEVCMIPEEDISDTPNLKASESRGFVKNIGKSNNNVILLLDCETLLSTDELKELNSAV